MPSERKKSILTINIFAPVFPIFWFFFHFIMDYIPSKYIPITGRIFDIFLVKGFTRISMKNHDVTYFLNELVAVDRGSQGLGEDVEHISLLS